MRELLNIKYGEFAENLLDMYLPDNNNYTTIVYFHGGGLESGKKDSPNFVEIAKSFAKNGYGFVSVDYRLYKKAKFPDYIIDCANSVKYVKDRIKDYGGNGSIIISGQSAGAWISLMLCLNNKYLKDVGIDSSSIDGWIIDSAQTTSHFNVIKYELNIDSRKQVINEFAPLYFIDENSKFSKMLLIYYENDMPCRQEQNLLFEKNLKVYNDKADVTMIKLQGGHCNGSSFKDSDGEYPFVKESLKWLKK